MSTNTIRIDLKSGNTLDIQLAPFSTGWKLFKVLSNELKLVDIELESLDIRSIGGKDINTFKNAILQLLGSDAVEACIFECFKRARHNDNVITKDTFDGDNTRGDFLPCAWEVIKFNIVPFFTGLDVKSLTNAKANSEGPK